MDISALQTLMSDASFGQAVAASAMGFAALYFGAGVLSAAVTRRVLAPLGIGTTIDSRPVPAGQIGAEIRRSLLSIGVFALMGGCLLLAYRAGVVAIVWQASAGVVIAEVIAILLFNELHFYAVHRLLHTPKLFGAVHEQHHRSERVTPWTSYSFHPAEAVLLGSVMPCAMLLHDFHVAALLALPLFSMLVNSVGHSNHQLLRSVSASRRHQGHHGEFDDRYGLWLPVFDWLFERKRRAAVQQGWRAKWPLGLAVLVVTVGLYVATNRLIDPSGATVLPLSAIDRLTPLVPASVWIYASFPALFLTVYALETDRQRIQRYLAGVVALNLVSNLVFILWPTTFDRGVLATAGQGVTGALLDAVRLADRPVNCLPSLHVGAAVFAGLFRRGKRFDWAFMAWAVAIAVSTLTTKQHYLVDVVAGVALAVAADQLFLRTRAPLQANLPTSATN